MAVGAPAPVATTVMSIDADSVPSVTVIFCAPRVPKDTGSPICEASAILNVYALGNLVEAAESVELKLMVWV